LYDKLKTKFHLRKFTNLIIKIEQYFQNCNNINKTAKTLNKFKIGKKFTSKISLIIPGWIFKFLFIGNYYQLLLAYGIIKLLMKSNDNIPCEFINY